MSLLVDFRLMVITDHRNRRRANRYRLTEAAMREAGTESGDGKEE